ncbi:hypothetical protein G7Y89_g14314 [Cudoniella acicularis]|uniref:DUF7924 domain-containing protein n=1 Tax=Cudoniella acicularis TaxID=354080 RepID=A0A8H4R3R0_9HELO|nr:hypothetical protein G7Y89_g14314 [Cudoniella acicularis]
MKSRFEKTHPRMKLSGTLRKELQDNLSQIPSRRSLRLQARGSLTDSKDLFDQPPVSRKRQFGSSAGPPTAKRARKSPGNSKNTVPRRRETQGGIKLAPEHTQRDEKHPSAEHPPDERQPQNDRPPQGPFLEGHINKLGQGIDLRPHNCPGSVSSFVTEWLETIPDDPQDTAPGMEVTKDADGFVVPRTPASSCSRPSLYSDSVALTAESARSSGRSLVQDPFYQENNLEANNIYLRQQFEAYPDRISALLVEIRRDRTSPGPSVDEIRRDEDLYELERGIVETDVERYFDNKIFASPKSSDVLRRVDKLPISKRNVPDTGTQWKVSTPIPDMLFGYDSKRAFPDAASSVRKLDAAANSQGLLFPFMVVEFKADGRSGAGSLWVATNQCQGGSASCINIAERLNYQLRQCESENVQQIDTAAFSIAMSGTEARLYISWKQNELDYYTNIVDRFLLLDPDHYLKFRKYVRNIVDWGRDKRLKQIQASLDTLLEKGMPIPSSDSSQKRKGSPSSSSRASSSKRGAKSTSHERG